jgi:uncharacterized protein YutE (UPF0331/DUF86 family)
MDEPQNKLLLGRIKMIEEHIGHALWEVQGLEQLVTKYYTFINLSDIPKFTDENFKKTLGVIVRKLKKITELDEEFDRRLSHFVDERNWLVHRIRLHNFNDMMKKTNYQSLIRRVNNLSEEARNLIHVFDELMMEHCKQLGDTPDIIEEKQQELINSWIIS